MLRNRDVRGILILLVGLAVVMFIWDAWAAQSVATIIDALAAATPEKRAIALNYLGQGALILFFGFAIISRMITAINKRKIS